MKRILQVVLCLLAFPVAGSHIVGGEFEVLHLADYRYRINLIIYFDEVNGIPANKQQDATINAIIYRKSDNSFIRYVNLPFTSEVPVNYTIPECAIGEIQTSRMLYTTEVTLSPQIYDDPEGYYIVWERCCRNYSITNIFSEESIPPTINPNSAGQTFYLEFSPVVKEGIQFINSSPKLFPPLSDYACPNRSYYADFSGTDDDGDSLVYSITIPWDTRNHAAYPGSGPAPYPEVRYRTPFSEDNMMGGSPDLVISRDGVLRVTPTMQGLYVFAVKCEEFRDGVKIGEVRRDFQLFVVDNCPQADPPQILGKKLTDGTFAYDNTMSVSFSNTVADEDRCIVVRVSDPDASKADQGFQERIWIKAVPLGFKADISEILPADTAATLINGDTREFRICFDRCPPVNGPFQVGIVAGDDACSLPLLDTLKVTVTIQPPPNAPPQFVTPPVTATLNEGELRTWTIEVVDPDQDPLVLGFIPVGFVPATAGMDFQITHQENGRITGQLTWDARCDEFDFSTKTNFELLFIAEDIDDCMKNTAPVLRYNLGVLLPSNHRPIIDSDLTPNPQERLVTGITRHVFESLSFNVTGSDLDNDLLVLDVEGVGFNINTLDVEFASVQGNGAVLSPFTWNIDCDIPSLATRDTYTFRFFVVDDANRCSVSNVDTLDVEVQILPPDNLPPLLQVSSLNPRHVLTDGHLDVTLGEQIELGLYGNDPDLLPVPDFIRIEMIDARGTVAPYGYVFAPGEGTRFAETTFTWLPECSIFVNEVYSNDYSFKFRVYDGRCHNVLADTVTVTMTISDVESDLADFLPPNFITPNNDNCNDFFAMEGIDLEPSAECLEPDDPDGIVQLPNDNCIRHFRFVKIFNRWGEPVFESSDRAFRWYAKDVPNGVYYYTIAFSDKEFRSTITVRY